MIGKSLKRKWAIAKDYWRSLWLSHAERERARAIRKLMFNLLGNAPMDRIAARESCTWEMTPEQRQGSSEAVQAYVDAVKSKGITDA